MSCKYQIEFNDEILTFDSEELMNKFLRSNHDRINQKLKGQAVSASKPPSVHPKAQEVAVILNEQLAAVQSLGGVVNDYDANLGTRIENPLQAQKQKGFVAVTKHIESKTTTVDGYEKKILLSYVRENHIAQMQYMHIATLQGIPPEINSERKLKEYRPELVDSYVAKREEVFNNPELKAALEASIQEQLGIFDRQNLAGRLIHRALELALNYISENGISKFYSDFTLAHLDNISVNMDLSVEESLNIKNVLYSSLVQKNGLVEKLGLQDQAYIFAEYPIANSNSETNLKLMGVIDLVVVSKDGKVRIFDFKTSNKNPDAWSHAKDFRIHQQLGYYAAMLKQAGVTDILEVSYVPITIETNNQFKTLANVTVNAPVNIKSDLTDTKLLGEKDYFKRIRKQVSEDISFTPVAPSNLQNIDSVDHFLKMAFGLDYKDKGSKVNLEKSFETAWQKTNFRDEMGKMRKAFWNPNTREMQLFPQDKEAQRELFIAEKKKYIESQQGGSVTQIYEDAILKYKLDRVKSQDPDSIPFVLLARKSETNKANVVYRKIFGKYKSDDWELLDSPAASQLGIIIFTNKITKVVDIVSVTSDPPNQQFKLDVGNSLLGKVYSDSSSNVNNNKHILPATNGNVELMKIMAFLNFNADYFHQQGYFIGDIKAVYPHADGVYHDFDVLKENLFQIMSAIKEPDTYYLNKINLTKSNPILSLLEKIKAIDVYHDARLYGFEHGYQMEKFVDSLKEQTDNLGQNWIYGAAQQEILEILNTELKRRLAEKELTAYISPTQEDFFTKMIVDQINYYTNSYLPKHEDELSKPELMFNSIKSLPSPLIQSQNSVLNVAIENIKRNFLKYKEAMSVPTTKLFEVSGYPKIRRYTIGDHSNAFKHLFQTQPGSTELDRRFILKDPYKDKTLNEAQKEYLIKLLTHFNKAKGITDSVKELSDAGREDFLLVPLVKKQALSFLKQGDYSGWIKKMQDKVYNPLTDLFGEEDHSTKKSIGTFLETTNFIANQGSSEVRDRMLEEGLDIYETNLEIVTDIFTLTHYRSKEFDKALPLIQAIKVSAIMDNVGVLRDISPITQFIDNHLKIVVKGERFPESKAEKKQDRWLSVQRQLTSIFNLALNPISIARELTQSIYGVVSRAQFDYYGENTHSLKDLTKQFGIILGNSSKDLYSDINIIESLNVLYGLSNMSLQSIIDRSSTSKTGLPHLFSNYIQGFNRAPEYMVRLGIMVAEMIKDGAWQAHSFDPKTNKLTYDWKKDQRFSVYASGDKSHKDYNNQKSLYLAMLQEFNRAGATEIELKPGDALPQAYTTKQQESLKAYADTILGYYDPESKYQVMSTLLGANFFHFKNWMTAVKDKWLLKGHVSQIQGHYVQMKNEQGELLWINESTGALTTDPSSGLKALIWEGKWCEGIFMSISRLIAASKGMDLSSTVELYKNDQKIRQNLKLMTADLLMIMIMMLLIRLMFADKDPEDLNLTSQIMKAVVSAPQDLQITKNIESVIKPNAGWIFPSVSYFAKLGQGQQDVIVGDRSFQKYVFSQFGVLRPFQHMFEE